VTIEGMSVGQSALSYNTLNMPAFSPAPITIAAL
jgi:hypothetical protein